MDRRRCKCGMPLISSKGAPYTPDDDVDSDGLCQWCRHDEGRGS
jgi:hypothetical protein